MDDKELREILEQLRFAQTDSRLVEVKEAVVGLPTTMIETVSAFSNGSGGVIILGVSERNGFHPAPGFKAKPMADAMAGACREKLTPPVQPLIDIAQYERSPVVVARIPEMSPLDKPCYITARGQYAGSYIRVSDGDRKLTTYEVNRMSEEKQQPRHDLDVIDQATKEDLLPDILNGILARQRELHPRVFASMSDDEALLALGVLGRGESGRRSRPTLAGLLVAGNYPQSFFPCLTVAFTAYPGTDKADADGTKRVDSFTAAGPIPEILDETLDAVRRNMRTGEYPIEAVREVVCNALLHRDYSPMAQGTPIQVNMYTDRLEVLSPGGLYGAVTIDNLGESGILARRNMTLAALLETTPYHGGFVVESMGANFQRISTLLQANGNGKPLMRDSLSMFIVTFASGAARGGQAQRDSAAADDAGDKTAGRSPVEQAMLEYIAAHSPAQAPDLAEQLGIPRSTVTYQLRKLLQIGLIERTQPARSPKQSYRIRNAA